MRSTKSFPSLRIAVFGIRKKGLQWPFQCQECRKGEAHRAVAPRGFQNRGRHDVHAQSLKKYRVADLITGYGVSESVRHYYRIYGGQVSDKRVVVQGWGNVGAAAAFYLAQAGAVVVGIIDRAGGIIAPEGLSFEEVTQLFEAKQGNNLNAADMLSFDEVNARIWDVEADVFLPCAASRLITQDQLNRMVKAGVEVISSGANVPFADAEIFYGPIAESADGQLAVVPDFIANCGMARVFAYLMSESDVDLIDEAIFSDTSATIERALQETHGRNQGRTGLAATAFEIALSKLMPAQRN